MTVIILQIQPQQQSLSIEIDPNIKIYEVLEFVKEFLKISEDIQKWTCYSEKKCQYLDQLSVFGNIQNEKLTINTAAIKTAAIKTAANTKQKKRKQKHYFVMRNNQDNIKKYKYF